MHDYLSKDKLEQALGPDPLYDEVDYRRMNSRIVEDSAVQDTFISRLAVFGAVTWATIFIYTIIFSIWAHDAAKFVFSQTFWLLKQVPVDLQWFILVGVTLLVVIYYGSPPIAKFYIWAAKWGRRTSSFYHFLRVLRDTTKDRSFSVIFFPLWAITLFLSFDSISTGWDTPNILSEWCMYFVFGFLLTFATCAILLLVSVAFFFLRKRPIELVLAELVETIRAFDFADSPMSEYLPELRIRLKHLASLLASGTDAFEISHLSGLILRWKIWVAKPYLTTLSDVKEGLQKIAIAILHKDTASIVFETPPISIADLLLKGAKFIGFVAFLFVPILIITFGGVLPKTQTDISVGVTLFCIAVWSIISISVFYRESLSTLQGIWKDTAVLLGTKKGS